MDEFNYLQFLNDDNELLQAEDVLLGDFPTFSLHFDEFFVISTQDPCDLESSKKETNENKTTTNPEPTQEVDVCRFPVVSNDAIQELTSVAANKNSSRSTKQWMNVFTSWCQSRHLENVTIETMAPEELVKVLSKFYTEVKKKEK